MERARVLIVDDDAASLEALARTLRADFEVTACATIAQAKVALLENTFSVIISDYRMHGGSGTAFLSDIAKPYPHISRILITAFTDSSALIEAINRAEIYRFVSKPWENADLVATVKQAAERSELLVKNAALVSELARLNESLEAEVQKKTAELTLANRKLEEMAMTDPLTGLHNRRSLMARLNEELERARRHGRSIVLALIDLDHFKHFNDSEGHVYGDAALKKVAGIFTANTRKTDTVARYGGEEFLVVMPETQLKQATEICERLRAAVEAAEFQGKRQAAYITVSIGTSVFAEDGKTAEELIEAADRALYAAKEGGRNRVSHESESESESFFV